MGVCSLRTVFHLVVATHYFLSLYYVLYRFYLPRTEEFNMFHSFGGHYRFLTNWDLWIFSIFIMIRHIWHILGATMFIFSCYYDWFHTHLPETIVFNYAGKLKFLTYWDALLQAIFFVICVLNDFVGTNEFSPKKTPIIRKIKDYIHVSLGFPTGSFVAITFWGLYAIDRELVFPKALDPYFPLWLNHIMHTNVFIFTFVEMITSFRVYPSRKSGLTGLVLFMLTYLIWTLVIFSKTGRWVYPVMEVLNWPSRIAFMATLLMFSIALYFAGEFLNNWVWRKDLKQVATKKKTK